MPLPTVAIIGRPNVGKSTLFNRLVGRRVALVDDLPGVTRDRREGEARLFDLTFRVMDTAGFEDEDPTSLPGRMRAQTEAAVCLGHHHAEQQRLVARAFAGLAAQAGGAGECAVDEGADHAFVCAVDAALPPVDRQRGALGHGGGEGLGVARVGVEHQRAVGGCVGRREAPKRCSRAHAGIRKERPRGHARSLRVKARIRCAALADARLRSRPA